jgi:hypothetical protein
MAKTKTLVILIREIVKAEVQKEVKKIFIKENVKDASIKPKRKKSKEVSYTKNPTLNKILNETAQSQEFEEYPSMGEYDTSNMAELIGYGETSVGDDDETKRKVAAVQTAQAAGVDPNNVPEEVMGALTRDYRDVMKAIDKRDNK